MKSKNLFKRIMKYVLFALAIIFLVAGFANIMLDDIFIFGTFNNPSWLVRQFTEGYSIVYLLLIGAGFGVSSTFIKDK